MNAKIVIDGNAFYELDEACLQQKRKKEKPLSEKESGNKKKDKEEN